jgi:hypothetical protein
MQLRRQFVSITEIIPAQGFAGTAPRRRNSAALPTLPAVAPGQLWLVGLPAEGSFSASVRHVLGEASVVIYDRAIVDAVAHALPLGTYAEPAPADGAASEAAAARSVRFARDGWSVARVLSARLSQRERTRRVQDVVDQLAAVKVLGRLQVPIFATAADGIEEQITARFDDLTAIVASYPRDTRLAIAG